MNERDRSKYDKAAEVCSKVLQELIRKVKNKVTLQVKDLCDYGDSRLKQELDKVDGEKWIAFPTSISLNNCVGNYIYETGMDAYNEIRDNAVVKIELGINIGSCIVVRGETVIVGNSEEGSNSNTKYTGVLKVLDDLEKRLKKEIKAGCTNDEVRMYLESALVERGCYPVENTFSYQHLNGQLQTDESKYIVLNYKKYYDEEDNLIVEENECFELLDGEVYTINIAVIPEGECHAQEYIDYCQSHIYRYNDYFYNLRLNSSREFYSKVKRKHANNAFSILEYTSAKDKLGMKESLANGLLEMYPILYNKSGLPVFHKKFTIIVGGNRSIILK